MMILLLVYPARKRMPSLAPIGSVKAWFQIHMVLGVLGPLLVLFHSNFRTGATNSNVALYCMLLVSGSGLIGRYFYSRIHTEMNGSHETPRGPARAASTACRWSRARWPSCRTSPSASRRHRGRDDSRGSTRFPACCDRRWSPGARVAGPAAHRIRICAARAQAARAAARHPARTGMQREMQAARELACRHIDAVRRVTELITYERLFSLWHVLHLPLFFMLLVAGIVHVVAVHVY